jgi:phospholipid transport system substrate-binding protein
MLKAHCFARSGSDLADITTGETRMSVHSANGGTAGRGSKHPLRAVLAGCVALLTVGLTVGSTVGLAVLVSAGPAHADKGAIRYMDQVARELIAATRTRAPDVLAGVIRRHGDVGWIGAAAIGSYRPGIAAADRKPYLDGTVRFMARYVASQAPQYPVASYRVLGAKADGPSHVHVDTRVQLANGTTYDVRWLLAKRGGTYKVRDAQVMGFWMTPLLRKIFEDYIGENGGRVKALVTALNR